MYMNMNMKKIYYLIFVAVLGLAASCQDPQFIEPTAERQGITSLTAYFTTGKYVDQQLAKLDVADENMDYYVIEIPWFFPEETEDPTTIYMSNLRIRAELAPKTEHQLLERVKSWLLPLWEDSANQTNLRVGFYSF